MAKYGEGDKRWKFEDRPDCANVHKWHWSETNYLERPRNLLSRNLLSKLLATQTVLDGEGEFMIVDGAVTGTNVELQEGKMIVQKWRFISGTALIIAAHLLGACLPGTGAIIMAILGGPTTEGPCTIVSRSLSEPIIIQKAVYWPLHLAARVKSSSILQHNTDYGCYLNATTNDGDTTLIIRVRYKPEDCLRVLAKVGTDVGSVNLAGVSASSLAGSNQWYSGLQQAPLDTVRTGRVLRWSKSYVFSHFLFVARSGDIQARRAVFEHGAINLDENDIKGFSAVMITAMEGHDEAFRFLVYAGKEAVKLTNKSGEITLSKLSPNYDLLEKVILEIALERGNRSGEYFFALQYAACQGA